MMRPRGIRYEMQGMRASRTESVRNSFAERSVAAVTVLSNTRSIDACVSPRVAPWHAGILER